MGDDLDIQPILPSAADLEYARSVLVRQAILVFFWQGYSRLL